MKLGVMGAGLGAMGWDKALDYCQKVGLDAIELPVGCYPGKPFFDPDEVLKTKAAQKQIVADCRARGLEIIGLAVHGNPVHPDRKLAKQHEHAHDVAVRLAPRLGTNVVMAAAVAPGSDAASVANVSFYVSGTLVACLATAPFTSTWQPTQAGDYPITAIEPEQEKRVTDVSKKMVSGSYLEPGDRVYVPQAQITVITQPHFACVLENKPVHVVVSTVPGPLDTFARIICEKMSTALKQPFVIENKAGAGGNIAAEQVAKAAPDGYTLLFSIDTTFTVNPGLYKKLPFDPARDFATISVPVTYGQMLTVHPSVPANSVADLVKLAKEKPLTYASGGHPPAIVLGADGSARPEASGSLAPHLARRSA
jgi:hypothetical protein